MPLTRALRSPLLAGTAVLVSWLVFAAIAPGTSLREGATRGGFWGAVLVLVLLLGQSGRRRAHRE